MNPNQSPVPTTNQWQQPQPAAPPHPQTPHAVPVFGQQQVSHGALPGVRPDSSQELARVVSSSQEVLCKATTVFPFVLFPDTITVDREKVTITHKSFFKTADTTSLHIDDILNVAANVGPFFGSLKVTIRNVPMTKPPEIQYLTRKDVMRIKNILQGYIIARQSNIDCASMPKEQLIGMLQNLGSGRTGLAPH